MTADRRLKLVPRADPTVATRGTADADAAEVAHELVELDLDTRRDKASAVAVGALFGVATYLSARAGASLPQPALVRAPATEAMTADDVAVFLGVDRNTVYEYANRGAIPHQRLGKRLLFHRDALVSWLASPCRATSTRKG